MVKIQCVRVFVDPMEVGKVWTFDSREQAEQVLGWFFIANNCDVKECA